MARSADITILGTNTAAVACVPIGALMVTAVLEQAGFRVDFRDYQTYTAERKPAVATFTGFLEDVTSPIIGLSVMANSLPTVLGAVSRLKQLRPDTTIVLGGPGASDVAHGIVAGFPVDIVVRGEGEATVVELLQALENGRDLAQVAGIVYRCDDQVVDTGWRQRIEDLDSLPLPAYHHVNLADYPPGHAAIITTRGCPYRCTFCSAHSVWQRRITRRSPERVVEEIAAISDQVAGIEFHDDTFVCDPPRLRRLLGLLRANGLELEWSCNGRVDQMTPALLAEMAEHGCREIFFGLESGSDQVLARINKRIDSRTGQAVVKQALEVIGRVVTSYIWGFPFETLDDFVETMMAVCHDTSQAGVRCQLGLLSPLPCSPLFEQHGQSLGFSTELGPSAVFPAPDRLDDYPELVELILGHRSLFAPFYHFAHPLLDAKAAVMQRLMA